MLRKIVIFPIQVYQRLISPFFHCGCRYQPSCSHYAIEAVEKHGVLRGCFLVFKRILRCHPFGSFGMDPVPEREK